MSGNPGIGTMSHMQQTQTTSQGSQNGRESVRSAVQVAPETLLVEEVP